MKSKQDTGNPTKQERRREKQRKQQEEQRRTARLKRITIISSIVAIVIVVTVLVLVVFVRSRPPATAAQPSTKLLYAPIDAITCQSSEQSGIHVHAHLSLYLNGKNVPVPTDIGVAPDGSCLYWLHTHDTSGVIHVEAPAGKSFTLKNFLDIWKSQWQYPSELNQSSGWQVYVDGKQLNGDFHSIPLQAHTLITLAFKSPGVKPDISYPWNGL